MAKTKNTKATRTRVSGKTVETIRHTDDKRKNIPSAEHQSVLEKTEAAPRPVKYLRNTDLDPQLVWRGKDEQDWTDLVVQAPPLYIQERVHPKVLVDDLLRQSKQTQGQAPGAQFDLFGDFNGIPEGVDRTEFYQHDQNWSNRMILGDSLQVMATAGCAAPTWSVSTSSSTIPATKASRACGNCPTASWCRSKTCTRPRSGPPRVPTTRPYAGASYQQGVNVRLAGPGGSPMTWSLADPAASAGWGSSQIALVRRLTPHIRQFIRVRQALVRAQAGDTTVTALLETPRIGVVHLDRRGRILAVNDRALSLLRQGEWLSDEDGVLQAREPDDQYRLARLVADALPTSGAVPVSGSMRLGRVSGLPPFVVHIKPVGVPPASGCSTGSV